MSEEEIINILSDEIVSLNVGHEKHEQAVKGLLDLYNKEKEKNKTLEELLQGRLFELYKYYKDLASKYQGNCVTGFTDTFEYGEESKVILEIKEV